MSVEHEEDLNGRVHDIRCNCEDCRTERLTMTGHGHAIEPPALEYGRADADIAPALDEWTYAPRPILATCRLSKPETSRLPTDAAARKALPVATGVLDYFPDALAAVAHASKVGNDQHSPGQPLHWAKEKSTDEADCLIRHFLERGTTDTDGVKHSAKVAWRALALLQREIEVERRMAAFEATGRDPISGNKVTFTAA